MIPTDPSDLLARLRALPAGAPLMRRLEGERGMSAVGGGVRGIFLVGGGVRDLLLGGSPHDLDLVVEGDPAAARSRLDGDAVIHDRFGTSTVTVDGFAYDIATARRETYERPGALPQVTPASLEDDLRRRDFTVNAIAIELGGARAGELQALPRALEDLDRRRLRVLHPRSFIDDPTRLFRLARYRARLDFGIEEETLALARQAVGENALATVSGHRIGNELRLLAREPDPVAALRALQELDLAGAIDPRFGLDDEELARRALELLPADGRQDRLVLALAARGVPSEDLRGLLERLGFDANDRDVVLVTAARAPSLASELEATKRPSEIADVASGAPAELVALAGALGPAEAARDWLERLRHVELEIDGRDLLAAGVPEGAALGRGLRAALAAKLDGQARTRQEELNVALRAAGEDG